MLMVIGAEIYGYFGTLVSLVSVYTPYIMCSLYSIVSLAEYHPSGSESTCHRWSCTLALPGGFSVCPIVQRLREQRVHLCLCTSVCTTIFPVWPSLVRQTGHCDRSPSAIFSKFSCIIFFIQ